MGKFESIGTIQPFLQLQEGEWADVYKAYDASQSCNVLLKRLKAELQHDAEISARFEQEAALMTRINHPNVVRVLSAGRDRGRFYFVAEFVEGKSLSELLEAGRLPALLAAHILREATKGLDAAHQAGIFHRDIKPANLLVSDEGDVKLADFGMASPVQAAGEAELRGTLSYLAPELLFEGKPGMASDLFALGATFYKMLTGLTAFKGAATSEIIDQIVNYDPVPSLAVNPHVPPTLIRVCARLLDKKPGNRYPNCRALMHHLDTFISQLGSFDGKKELVQYLDAPEAYQDFEIEDAIFAHTEVTHTEVVHTDKLPEVHQAEGRLARPLALLSVVVLILLVWFLLPASDLEPGVEQAAETRVPAETEATRLLSNDDPGAEALPDSLESPVEAEPAGGESNARAPQASEVLPEGVSELVENELHVPVAGVDSSGVADLSEVQVISSKAVQKGLLNVLCTPHCTVVIDGDSMGTAPPAYTDSLAAGVYNIQLIHPALPIYVADVAIAPGQAAELRVPLKDFIGSVELSIWPYADVFIDGVAVGRVPPVKSFNLSPGQTRA